MYREKMGGFRQRGNVGCLFYINYLLAALDLLAVCGISLVLVSRGSSLIVVTSLVAQHRL